MKSQTYLNSKYWKILFLVAGIYTAGGVLPEILNPQKGVLEFTGKLTEELYTLYFFRSLWITVLVFGIGFFIASKKPNNHIGIVIMGFIGKLLFAMNVLVQYQNGYLSQTAFTAAIILYIAGKYVVNDVNINVIV